MANHRVDMLAIVVLLSAFCLPCWGVSPITETYDGSGAETDSSGAITGFDLPNWTLLPVTSEGAFDGTDSFDVPVQDIGFVVSIDTVGDIYQSIGQMNRDLGPSSAFTAHTRFENFQQGTASQVQSIDLGYFNFGNELGKNSALFELVGASYESFTGNVNGIVFVDAATTVASVSPVNVVPGGGNINSIDTYYTVGADAVNGGSTVLVEVSIDDGPLKTIVDVDGTIAIADFTTAANVNLALGYVAQTTLPVGDPAPGHTGASVDFSHVTVVPEPSAVGLLFLGMFGLLGARRKR